MVNVKKMMNRADLKRHRDLLPKLDTVEFKPSDFVKSKYTPKSFWSGVCVGVARKDGVVAVMDTKQGPEGQILKFTDVEWEAFLRGAKEGQFDV